MTANDLRDVLLELPELTLIGTTLLEALTGFFPVDLPRDTLREAVVEMVAYTDAGCTGSVIWSNVLSARSSIFGVFFPALISWIGLIPASCILSVL